MRHHRPDPAADAGNDCDIFASVGTPEHGRLADDPGACLVLPQQLAGLRVDRLEPPFAIAVEDEAVSRCRGTAPHRPALLDRPHLAPVDRVPGHELPGIAAGAWEE